METNEIRKAFREEGLMTGRMITDRKGEYIEMYPTHVPYFNANIVSVTHGKIWWGDLDVTEDAEAIKKVAEKIGEPLFVVKELDARFENENEAPSEIIKKAVWNTSEPTPYKTVKV